MSKTNEIKTELLSYYMSKCREMEKELNALKTSNETLTHIIEVVCAGKTVSVSADEEAPPISRMYRNAAGGVVIVGGQPRRYIEL